MEEAERKAGRTKGRGGKVASAHRGTKGRSTSASLALLLNLSNLDFFFFFVFDFGILLMSPVNSETRVYIYLEIPEALDLEMVQNPGRLNKSQVIYQVLK